MRFPDRVNAGYMQVLDRHSIALRVHERGAGETLSCGTGACAAVVAGIQRGLLDERVHVATRGGVLSIAWAGDGGTFDIGMQGLSAAAERNDQVGLAQAALPAYAQKFPSKPIKLIVPVPPNSISAVV